jgi:hypothetical protein
VINAFWTVKFRAKDIRIGEGVITTIDGRIYGGDSCYKYIGTYTENGGFITAKLRISKYSDLANLQSVVDIDNFNLSLSGKVQRDSIYLDGELPSDPNNRFEAILTRITDID